ncbi:glutamate--tRNA ligase [Brumimicrobium salinarum]|uniref:Glutamate--tRNA ligase n=1 Tax=Brumimicrobium salinarum TaxID=2058658 RepID=A0A2I0R6A6_9FLAO|nr:glutamate--tRNA ligase [Brumimicrobium salinarum]PKR82099.1 glutamate--tRNA ligase [Brumimicrobium salinarum]
MSDNSVRVRFAPSPTGPLHMGGVRTALYNYLFAKKNNGTFIIRIEDTDQTRYVEGAEAYIMEALKWCGITPDEGPGYGGEYGPYKQSERKEMYKPYAEKLIENGKAYYAFDTSEELDAVRKQAQKMKMPNWQYNSVTRTSMQNSLTLPEDEVKKRLENGDPYVIRFKMPRNRDVRFEDKIRGWVVVNTNNLDDKVLYKSDGMPTYHLANIVDDHTMKITHVIRGEEWLPSAPLHVLLYEAFEWKAPSFAHCPLLLRPDGNGKLSKRDGDRLGFPVFPIDWHTKEGEKYSGYRENGYFSGAFINMLAFLGWNPGTTQEIFSIEEMIEAFTLERVSKAGAKFDANKTNWFQQQYLRATENDILAELLKEEIGQPLKDITNTYLSKACELMKERSTFIKDIYEEGNYLFANPTEFDEKTVRKKWKENAVTLMTEWQAVLSEISDFEASTIEKEFKSFIAEKELGIGKVLPLFRLVITGKGMGPSMFEITALLGKSETLIRMEQNTSKIQALKE